MLHEHRVRPYIPALCGHLVAAGNRFVMSPLSQLGHDRPPLLRGSGAVLPHKPPYSPRLDRALTLLVASSRSSEGRETAKGRSGGPDPSISDGLRKVLRHCGTVLPVRSPERAFPEYPLGTGLPTASRRHAPASRPLPRCPRRCPQREMPTLAQSEVPDFAGFPV